MQEVEFPDISKSKLALLNSLKQKKVRNKQRLFVVEGEKCVLECLGSFTLKFIAAYPLWLKRNLSEFLFDGNDIFTISESEMKKISSFSTPSPVVACFLLPDNPSMPDKIDGYELMLDGIQDPGNLGTIIRTADWFGLKRIFASKTTADCFSAKTVQSSMGSIGRIEVIYCDLLEIANKFPLMPLIGLTLSGENIYNVNLPSCGFVVMGNEGNGISREMNKNISIPLSIPRFSEDGDGPESLNVSVATAIALSEIKRTYFINKRNG